MTTSKQKTALYVRVSTKEQRLDNQEKELKKWLKANGVPNESVAWYSEKGSGTTRSRKELDRLCRDIDDGKIDTVVVWKLDRLSRSLRDGVNLIADWSEKGIRLVSMTEGIDFASTMGKIIASLLSGLAQMETEYRRERQAVGIETAKARQIYKGRKPGTTRNSPLEAFRLRQRGVKVSQIAKCFGVTEMTIYRYLKTAEAAQKEIISKKIKKSEPGYCKRKSV